MNITGNKVLSINPGLSGSGVSLFVNKKLVRAKYVFNKVDGYGGKAWFGMSDAIQEEFPESEIIDQLIIELPRINDKTPYKPTLLNYLNQVGSVCGVIEDQLCEDSSGNKINIIETDVGRWTHGSPKPYIYKMVESSLTPVELGNIIKPKHSSFKDDVDGKKMQAVMGEIWDSICMAIHSMPNSIIKNAEIDAA